MNVSIKKCIKTKIDEEGFVFLRFFPEVDIYRAILRSSSPENEKSILEFFKEQLELHGLKVNKIQGVYEDIHQGMSHELHTHLIPTEYQVVIWVPEDFGYEGRAFVYGKLGELKKHYGQWGEMVIMKTNDLDFVHGVEPLKSKGKFRTLLLHINPLFSDGRHITVAANDYYREY